MLPTIHVYSRKILCELRVNQNSVKVIYLEDVSGVVSQSGRVLNLQPHVACSMQTAAICF